MTHRIESLREVGESVQAFTCGDLALDRWLIDHALNARGQGTRTYLLLADDGTVDGYFAVTPHSAARADLPGKVARGAPDPIPGYLIGKLAVARGRQGEGLGTELVIAALSIVVDAAKRAGGKLIFVDAIDERAEAFYARLDFIPCGDKRLAMKVSTAAKQLGIGWP